MNVPPIMQLRSLVSVRRKSDVSFLVMAFAAPLVTLVCFGSYQMGERCAAAGWAVEPLAAAAFFLWLVVGLSYQRSLTTDLDWDRFVRQMPVGPGQLLAVHIARGLLPAVVSGLWFLCGLWGAGIDLWGWPQSIRCLLLVLATIWILSLQADVAHRPDQHCCGHCSADDSSANRVRGAAPVLARHGHDIRRHSGGPAGAAGQ